MPNREEALAKALSFKSVADSTEYLNSVYRVDEHLKLLCESQITKQLSNTFRDIGQLLSELEKLRPSPASTRIVYLANIFSLNTHISATLHGYDLNNQVFDKITIMTLTSNNTTLSREEITTTYIELLEFIQSLVKRLNLPSTLTGRSRLRREP